MFNKLIIIVLCVFSLSFMYVPEITYTEIIPLGNPPIVIRTEADLRGLATAISSATAFTNDDGVTVPPAEVRFAHYNLTQSINLTVGMGQFPGIGTRLRPFEGIFTSGGRNLVIDMGSQNPVGTGSWGLFNYVAGDAEFTNITIAGTTSGATTGVIGSLIGTVTGGAVEIHNTHTTMNVTATMGIAGGVIGAIEQGQVEIVNSTASNITVTGIDYVGGIIGLVGKVNTAEVLIRQTSLTGFTPVPAPRFTNVNLQISGNESATRGLATGGVNNNSEVGVIGLGSTSPTGLNSNALAVFGSTSTLAAITLGGYIHSGAAFNALNVGVMPANFAQPFYMGDGDFNWVNINTGVRTVTLNNIGLGSITGYFNLLQPNIDVQFRYPTAQASSDLFTTFSTFTSSFAAPSGAVTGFPGEFSDILSLESGVVNGIIINYRLSPLVYFRRNLNLTLNLQTASIISFNTILFDIDTYTEVNLENHFETLPHPFKNQEQFRFRVVRAQDGRVRDVTTRDFKFVNMRPGEYTIHVFIYVPDTQGLHIGNTTVIGYYRFSTANFTMTVYDSAGQAFNPNEGTGGGRPSRSSAFIIFVYVLVPIIAVTICGIVVFFVLKRRRRI